MEPCSGTRRIDGSTRPLLFATALLALASTSTPTFASVKHPSWQVPPERGADRHDASVPVAVAVHVVETGDATRLVFDLSAPIAVRALLTEGPDRLIVDLPEVDFQIDAAAGATRERGPAWFAHSGSGCSRPGRSRIVVDLSAPSTPAPSRSGVHRGGRPVPLDDRARPDRSPDLRRRGQKCRGGTRLADARAVGRDLSRALDGRIPARGGDRPRARRHRPRGQRCRRRGREVGGPRFRLGARIAACGGGPVPRGHDEAGRQLRLARRPRPCRSRRQCGAVYLDPRRHAGRQVGDGGDRLHGVRPGQRCGGGPRRVDRESGRRGGGPRTRS